MGKMYVEVNEEILEKISHLGKVLNMSVTETLNELIQYYYRGNYIRTPNQEAKSE